MLNFTHSINQLSFGTYIPGITNPLDQTLQMTEHPLTAYQYFVSIVPTIYYDRTGVLTTATVTNQYGVTEFVKLLKDERSGSVPGIFFKYALEPISVQYSLYKM